MGQDYVLVPTRTRNSKGELEDVQPLLDRHVTIPSGTRTIAAGLNRLLEGCRFSIGIRNSHDKSLRLGLTAGLRVFVCSNMAFSGDFTPVLAKHTKRFNLVDTLSVGVDPIQRNFEPMQHQVESWRQTQISDARAKLIFYSAFVEGRLDAPKNL